MFYDELAYRAIEAKILRYSMAEAADRPMMIRRVHCLSSRLDALRVPEIRGPQSPTNITVDVADDPSRAKLYFTEVQRRVEQMQRAFHQMRVTYGLPNNELSFEIATDLDKLTALLERFTSTVTRPMAEGPKLTFICRSIEA